MSEAPSLYWSLPFVLILLQIAVWPVVAPHRWEKIYPWLTLPLGFIVVLYYLTLADGGEKLVHTGYEYFSFIVLLGALFTVSGGILVNLSGRLEPYQNVMMLGFGAVMANVVGTTGASMILIRPFLRGNAWRFEKYQLVFFIFLISNCGGALTPIGDPPLFLGYLRGVPFFWTLTKLWLPWLVAISLLLIVYYVMDRADFARQKELQREIAKGPDRLYGDGLFNILFLAMIVGASFVKHPLFLREAIMITCAVLSYMLTPRRIHERNEFDFHPIREVAVLFAAIFMAMVPALDWLSANAERIGLSSVREFYWLTGALSAILDNAPTYLNSLSAAMGGEHLNVSNADHVRIFTEQYGGLLGAISTAAVFFGAMTYIGNGPNFMCKAIAERAKVAVPSFSEYIWKYSIPILFPILWLTSFLMR